MKFVAAGPAPLLRTASEQMLKAEKLRLAAKPAVKEEEGAAWQNVSGLFMSDLGGVMGCYLSCMSPQLNVKNVGCFRDMWPSSNLLRYYFKRNDAIAYVIQLLSLHNRLSMQDAAFLFSLPKILLGMLLQNCSECVLAE